ncbi:TetR/AcrR family transcriptional regulator [Billgrantia azerbaijanica]|nr:TetR/AcrR family transcriptional regulator [Halomonas azerbaijanica]
MRKRAESQEKTRQRIVEATMQLHEELGPRATTISAIAERAGVQRLTVYRHFPDETAVFQACTSHWLDLNPPPNPQSWESIADPWERLAAALSAFYEYYAATERMWTVSHRDVSAVDALQEPMADFATYVTEIADDLAKPLWPDTRTASSVKVTVQHALAFLTWKDLQKRGVENARKVELVVSWLSGITQESQ